jgi:protocatechuate 3,4-dioxygenase alpha subunit
MTLPVTPSQTIGPFSHEAWQWACAACSSVESSAATVTISGILRDGDGLPIDDAMIEAWTHGAAGPEGEHALPGFRRLPSGDRRQLHADPDARRARVRRSGRPGHHLRARPADAPVQRRVPGGRQSRRLRDPAPGAGRAPRHPHRAQDRPGAYSWDIRMQGEPETVFFDFGGAA